MDTVLPNLVRNSFFEVDAVGGGNRNNYMKMDAVTDPLIFTQIVQRVKSVSNDNVMFKWNVRDCQNNVSVNDIGYWHHMATEIWVNIGTGNGLLPDGTKPLPEPILTFHNLSPVPQPSITKNRLKITYLKFHSNFSGVNELMITFHFYMLKRLQYEGWESSGLWYIQYLQH